MVLKAYTTTPTEEDYEFLAIETNKDVAWVAAYARVSSDSANQLNSYLAQVDYYTRHIAENPDWELADIYADEGSVVWMPGNGTSSTA